MKSNQKGFSTIEGLLIFVIVAIVGFTGWYIYDANKKTNTTYNAANQSAQSTVSKPPKQTTAKYLPIPQEGIKFQLSSEIKNAYYFKSQQGYIYLSTRTLDETKGAEGCAAKDTDGLGGGLVALVVGKVGQPNGSPSGDPWTQAALDSSGLTKVGDTYYGFRKGNAPCYDPDNASAAALASSTIQAFMKQQSTITKL